MLETISIIGSYGWGEGVAAKAMFWEDATYVLILIAMGVCVM